MMIDKISGVNPLANVTSTKRTSPASSVKSGSDQINISSEAKAMSEALYLNKVAEETPDVRSELVEQIKLKIQDPNYLNPERIAATADQILSAYGL